MDINGLAEGNIYTNTNTKHHQTPFLGAKARSSGVSSRFSPENPAIRLRQDARSRTAIPGNYQAGRWPFALELESQCQNAHIKHIWM